MIVSAAIADENAGASNESGEFPSPPRLALALIVLGLIVAIGLRAPVFVTPESLVGVLTDTSFLFMLALAQMGVTLSAASTCPSPPTWLWSA